MDDDGAKGAEAAAQYFLRLDDYIQATNDTAEWEAMSHQECGYCSKRLDQARDLAAKKYQWQAGRTTTRVIETYVQDTTTGIWPIDVEVDQAAVEVIDSAGRTVYSENALVVALAVEVARRDGDWVIVEVGEVPES
jgi:hypothetical protein